MANVLNRTTLEYYVSVHTPNYPVEDWVINPDLSPVDGVPVKYWKLTGDVLSEMDQAEKDAADAAEIADDLVLHRFTTADQKNQDHRTIDYKTSLTDRLHKKVTVMHRGEVREVRYYADQTETDLALVVRVCSEEACTNLGYSRNDLGAPLERWTERTWYRNDGSADPVKKVTRKVYSHDPVAQMTEGLRRRQNQIDKLSVDLLMAHVATTAVDPFNPTSDEMMASYNLVTTYNDKYEAGITTFVRVGRNDFLTPPDYPNVRDDPETWLDNDVSAIGYPDGWTIRTIILSSVKNISEA